MKVTSIILAGGRSQRFGGKRKALETIGGKSLIERVAERVRPLSSEVLVVISEEQFDVPAGCRAQILVDLYPDKGPLGGMYTGLLTSRCSRSLVVPCDAPFLSVSLLSYMVELSGDFDAVVPRLEEGKVEPLHAVYSKSCLGIMKFQLAQNQLRADSFFDAVRMRYVEREECLRFDPELLSFLNINRKSDLERAASLAAWQESSSPHPELLLTDHRGDD